MKNYTVFSLLGLTVLLTACPGTKPHLEISAPKFAAMGSRITAEQYYDGMFAGLNALAISNTNEETVLGDLRAHTIRSTDSTLKERENGSNVADFRTITKNELDSAFDSETKVGLVKEDYKGYYKGYQNGADKLDEERHNETSFYVEKVRIANADYIGRVYPDQRLVLANSGDELDETYTEAKMFSIYSEFHVKQAIDYHETYRHVQQFASMTEEELAQYTFYKNGNTYTSVFTKTSHGVDSTEVTYIDYDESEKIQVTFTEYGFDYLASYKLENNRKYLKDFGIFKKGDYRNAKSIGYIECKYEESQIDNDLEAVDYEGYTAEVRVLYP